MTARVDIYGARGDFDTAERVLRAGERNALDSVAIYDGVTEVLALRDSARLEDSIGPPAPAVAPEEEADEADQAEETEQ